MKKSFYKMKYLLSSIIIMLLFAVQVKAQVSDSVCLNETGTLKAALDCIEYDSRSSTYALIDLQTDHGPGHAQGHKSWNIDDPLGTHWVYLCENVGGGQESNSLMMTMFSFGSLLPSDPNGVMEITGIEISFDRMRDPDPLLGTFVIQDHSIGLLYNNAQLGKMNTNGRGTNWSISNWETITYGSKTNLWDAAITRDMVIDNTFGLYFAAEAQNQGLTITDCANAYVKNFTIKVHYRMGGQWYTASSGGTALPLPDTGRYVTFDQTHPTANINSAKVGNHSLWVTCADGSRHERVMRVDPLPVVAITGHTTICKGSKTTLSPTTGGKWTSNHPTVATVTDAGIVTGISAGSATFTFKSDATGCEKTTASVTVTTNTTPIITDITCPGPIYVGEEFVHLQYELNTPQEISGYQITWPAGSPFVGQNPADVFTFDTDGLYSNLEVIGYKLSSPLTIGTYQGWLQLKTANGCITDTARFSFTITTAAPDPDTSKVCVSEPEGVQGSYPLGRAGVFTHWAMAIDDSVTTAEYVVNPHATGTVVDLKADADWAGLGLTGNYLTWANTIDATTFNVDWKGSSDGKGFERYEIHALRYLEPAKTGGYVEMNHIVDVITPPHFYTTNTGTDIVRLEKVLPFDVIDFSLNDYVVNGIVPSGYWIEPADPLKDVDGLPATRTFVKGATVKYTIAADECVYTPVEYLIYPAFINDKDTCVSARSMTLRIETRFDVSMEITSLTGPTPCANDQVTFLITRNDKPFTTWQFKYFDGTGEVIVKDIADTVYSLSRPLTENPHEFRLIKVIDDKTGCEFTPTSGDPEFNYEFDLFELPKAEVTFPATICEDTDYSIEVEYTAYKATDDTWRFTYTDGVNPAVTVTGITNKIYPINPMPGLPAGNYNFTITGLMNDSTGCVNPDPLVFPFTVRQAPEVEITVIDTTGGVCEDYTIEYRVKRIDTEYRLGDDWSVEYVYDGTTYTPTSLTDEIVFNITAINNNGMSEIKFVKVENLETGCIYGLDTTMKFIVHDKPYADFNVMTNPVCNGGAESTVTFNIERTDAGATTDWSVVISDGTTDYPFTFAKAGGFNPGTCELPITATTTYTLTEIVNNVTGCDNLAPSTPIEVTIADLPAVTFVADATSPLCEDDDVEFTITRTDNASTDDWTAYMTITNGKDKQSKVENFTAATEKVTYTIDLIGDITITIDSILNVTPAGAGALHNTECWNMNLPQLAFTVNPKPLVKITVDTPVVCGDGEATFTIKRTDSGSTDDWSFVYAINGGAPTTVADIAVAEYEWTIALPEGDVVVTFIKVVNDETGCENPIAEDHNVKVNSVPTVIFTSHPAHNTEICEGEDIAFTVIRTDANVGAKWGFVIFSENLDGTNPKGTIFTTLSPDTATVFIPAEAVTLGAPGLTRRYYLESVGDSTTKCTVEFDKDLLIQLRILPKPQVSFELNVADSCCANTDVIYTVTRLDGGQSVEWEYTIEFEYKSGLVEPPFTHTINGARTHTGIYRIPANTPADSITARIISVNNIGSGCNADTDMLPDSIAFKVLEMPALAAIKMDGYLPGTYPMCQDQPFTLTFERTDLTYVPGGEWVINLLFNDVPVTVTANTKVKEFTTMVNDTTVIKVVSVVDATTGCVNNIITDEFTLNTTDKPQVTYSYVPKFFCANEAPKKVELTINGENITEPTITGAGWQYTWTALPEHPTANIKTVYSTSDLLTFDVTEYTTVWIYNIVDLKTGCTNYDTIQLFVTTPNVLPLPREERIFCEDVATTPITFEGLDMYVPGTMRFEWKFAGASGPMGLSGDDIAMFANGGTNVLPSFTPRLMDCNVGELYIEVTPIFNDGSGDCVGKPDTMTFYFVPTPEVTNIPDYSLCDGEPTLGYDLTGCYTRLMWKNVGGTYEDLFPTDWQIFNNNPVTFPEEEMVNKTDAPIDLLIEFHVENRIADIEGSEFICEKDQTWTITINPEPTITNVLPDTVYLCSGDEIAAIQMEGTALEFRWRATGENVGIDPWGVWTKAEDSIVPAFIVENLTSLPRTVVFEYMPIYGSSTHGNECFGEIDTTVFIINPEPKVDKPADVSECDMAYLDFRFTGVATSVEWTNVGEHIEGLPLPSDTTIIADASNDFNFGPYTLTNTTDWPNVGELTGRKAIIEMLPVYVHPDDPDALRCEGDIKQFEIVVNPTPRMIIQSLVYCHGEVVPTYEFVSTTDNEHTSYVWEHVFGPTLGLVQFGVDSIPGFIAENEGFETLVAYYTVTPTYEKYGQVCVGDPKEFMIIVNPRPIISPIADKVYCAGDQVPEHIFTGTPDGTTYKWEKISGDDIVGLDAEGYNVMPAFTAVNTTGATITAEYQVSASYQMANSTAAPCFAEDTVTFKISIVPNGTLEPIANVTACMGATNVEIELDGTATQYNWTVVEGEDVGLGFMSGTINAGDAWTFNAKNNILAPIYAIVEVTPVYTDATLEHTCTGTSVQFRIDIYPTPVVTPVNDKVYCADEVVPELVFTSNVTGMTYAWELQLADGAVAPEGFPITGTGAMPQFTAVNGTDETITAVYEVYAYNYASGDCVSEVVEFAISVVPNGTIAAIANQSECANTEITIPLIGTATQYNWTIIEGVDVGVNYMSGTIAGTETEWVFTTKSNITAPIYAVIEVTPVFTDAALGHTCTGTPVQFRVDVAPAIEAPIVMDREFVAGVATPVITFNGPIPGTTYKWEVLNGDVIEGLQTSGYDNIPSFIPVNNTTETKVYNIEVGATGACAAKDTFEIRIVPMPTINPISNKYQCYETFTLEFAGFASQYNWSIIDGVALDPVHGTSGIAYPSSTTGVAVLSVNPTTQPHHTNIRTATYRVVPVFEGWEGEPTIFTVTVYPPVIVNPTSNQEYCHNANVSETVFTGSFEGVTFRWTFDGPAIPGLPHEGVGAFPAYTATNTSTETKIYRVKVEPEFAMPNGVICNRYPSMNEEGFDITILPQPKVTNVLPRYEYCTGEQFPGIAFAGVGNRYEWRQIDGGNVGQPVQMGENAIPAFQTVNNGIETITATFKVTPFYEESGLICEGESETFVIVVKPNVEILPIASRAYCSNTPVEAIAVNATVSGAVISWEATGSDIGLPYTSGHGNIPAFTAMNTGATIAEATITLKINNECGNNEESFTITVYPDVKIDPASVANIALCPEEGATIIVNPVTNVPSPVTFKWNNDRSDIGWPWETIANTMYFEPIVNTTGEAIVANITVTPLYIKHVGQEEYCEGDAVTFTITLYPQVDFTGAVGHMGEICDGATFSYEGAVSHSEATLSWVRQGVAGINGGQGASGNGAVINEELTNTTDQAITVTYTFTVDYKGCQTVGDDITVTVLPTPAVIVKSMTEVCPDGKVFINVEGATEGLSYMVTLDDNAVQAGFLQMVEPEELVEGKLPIKSNRSELIPGVYTGAVSFTTADGCETKNYVFSFKVYQPLIIVYTTESVTGLCADENGNIEVELMVLVDADIDDLENLTYTWFKDGSAIANSNSATYIATKPGSYQVEVSGSFCSGTDPVPSDIITVELNDDLEVKMKWDNVLYVDDPNNEHAGYQWYRNGIAINEEGNAQYYSLLNDPVGVEYEYTVRIYYADGVSRTTCPEIASNKGANNLIKVYPNPVKNADNLTVYLDIEKAELNGAQISIYDVTGKLFTQRVADEATVTISMNAVPGVYVVHVVTASGEVYTEKVVVR